MNAEPTAVATPFDTALRWHQTGACAQAIEGYRAVLQANDQHADAWNLLGLALHAQGQSREALLAVNRAVALKRHPKYLADRAAICLGLGEPKQALDDARAAIKADPSLHDAHVNATVALRQLGQGARACRQAEQGLVQHPHSAALWNNLGACLLDHRQTAQAEQAFERALALDPAHLAAVENLAKVSVARDGGAAAQAWVERALALGSRDLTVLTQALRHDPKPEHWTVLTTVAPDADLIGVLSDADLRNRLYEAATWLQQNGQAQAATRCLQRAAQVQADHPETWNNLGVSQFAMKDHAAALASFEQALALRPDFAMAWRNVGVCHFMLVSPEAARQAFQRSHELDPSSVATQLYLFGQALQCCEWSHYSELRDAIMAAGRSPDAQAGDLSASLAYLAAVESADDMRRIAAKVAHSLASKVDPTLVLEAMPLQPRQRRRLAYFSHDFREHPVGYLTEELYGLHDRSRFEVLALSYGPDDGSAFRQTVAASADRFIDLQHCTMAEMVHAIRALDIDILIDLTGNTQGTRSEVLMHRVAPIQVHWLGYVWSMGHPAYDHIIADGFSIPPELAHGYSESVLRMPETLQISSRRLQAHPEPLTREAMGLPEEAFVLCNFGSFGKLQPDLFKVWMQVLRQLPHAVLWLARTHRTPVEAHERLRAFAQAHGVDPARLVFSEPLSRDRHLHRYSLADLALDTFPQGSGTTAIEALWMGCPMLSMAAAGETLSIRMAGGILQAAGLPDMVVDSQAAYERLAIGLGRAPERLAAMRRSLLSRRERLPLFDTPSQVRKLEALLLALAPPSA